MKDIDTNLYSRQIKTYGIETMLKLKNLRVLILGMRGLGIEIAKNIILSGVKEVKILDEKGSPLTGVDVTFNINGVFYTRQTNSDGIASLNINLIPGNYIITAQYGESKVSNNIKVLSIIETHDVVMKYMDGTKFSAKILDNQGNPYPNQSVTFNINGVFYTKISGENGIANLNINLQAGKYIITSMFNKLSVSNTILINNI